MVNDYRAYRALLGGLPLDHLRWLLLGLRGGGQGELEASRSRSRPGTRIGRHGILKKR